MQMQLAIEIKPAGESFLEQLKDDPSVFVYGIYSSLHELKEAIDWPAGLELDYEVGCPADLAANAQYIIVVFIGGSGVGPLQEDLLWSDIPGVRVLGLNVPSVAERVKARVNILRWRLIQTRAIMDKKFLEMEAGLAKLEGLLDDE